MGVDSRVGRRIGRHRKRVSSPPLPYIGSKWSRTDFGSYFEHKNEVALAKRFFLGETNSVVFLPPTGEYRIFWFSLFLLLGG